jgi:SAM-dependent methyltransferase
MVCGPVRARRGTVGVDDQNTVAATLDMFLQTPHLNRWIFDRLRPWCGRRVLEVGAGIGSITELLSDRELVVATETEEAFLERLRARFAGRPGVVVQGLDLENIDADSLRAHQLDTVVCVNVLEHVRDDRGALERLREVIEPGGRLLLYLPALPWLYGSLDRGLQHHRRYARRPLEELLRGAGWQIQHLSWMNVLGIPGWFLNSRILGRKMLPLRQVALYDRLTPVLRLEERLRPRFGMSLVVACERTP